MFLGHRYGPEWRAGGIHNLPSLRLTRQDLNSVLWRQAFIASDCPVSLSHLVFKAQSRLIAIF